MKLAPENWLLNCWLDGNFKVRGGGSWELR